MALSQGRQSLEVSQQEAQQELDAVLAYPDIARSANIVRLLRFICTKYFAGRSQDIRESAIAIQALGRRERTFDSQIDPIVRVTARMLRKRLEIFYHGEGRHHEVRLELPVGHYIPHFVRVAGSTLADNASLRNDGNARALTESPPQEIPLSEIAVRDQLVQLSAAREDLSIAASKPLNSRHNRPLFIRLAVAVGFILACAVSFYAGRSTAVASGNGHAKQGRIEAHMPPQSSRHEGD